MLTIEYTKPCNFTHTLSTDKEVGFFVEQIISTINSLFLQFSLTTYQPTDPKYSVPYSIIAISSLGKKTLENNIEKALLKVEKLSYFITSEDRYHQKTHFCLTFEDDFLPVLCITAKVHLL